MWLKKVGNYDKVDDKIACENDNGAGTTGPSSGFIYEAASITDACVEPEEEIGAYTGTYPILTSEFSQASTPLVWIANDHTASLGTE